MPYAGALVDPEGAAEARQAAGGLILNFNSVELITIALLRVLLPAGTKRKALIQGPLRPRIKALVPLLQSSDLLDDAGKCEAVEALEKLHAYAIIRNTVAHAPYLRIGDQGWVWAELKDAEPDFAVVQTASVDKIKLVIDLSFKEVQTLERVLFSHIGQGLKSGR